MDETYRNVYLLSCQPLLLKTLDDGDSLVQNALHAIRVHELARVDERVVRKAEAGIQAAVESGSELNQLWSTNFRKINSVLRAHSWQRDGGIHSQAS